MPPRPAPTLRRLAALIALWAALCWPALLNGGALWFDDVRPYVKGGHLAVRTVLGEAEAPSVAAPADKVPGTRDARPLIPEAVGRDGDDPGLAPTRSVRGARAIAYSVAAYLGAVTLPAFWTVALVQAGVLAWLALALAWAKGLGVAEGSGLCAVLVLGTSAPFVATAASPDVWAGLLILSFVLLDAYRTRLGAGTLVLAGLVAAFSVASHASHVALAGALVAASLLASAFGRARRGWLRAALPAGVVAAGVAGTVGAGVIGFGEASVAPKRYPIVLARAVEDGPALWHLEEHCDEYRYAVCELFGEDVPNNVGDFLWNDGGVRDLATPAQMDRIRAEEALIVRRATMEYPFAQARRAGGNVLEQLADFGVIQSGLGARPDYRGRGVTVRQETGRWGALLGGLTTLHVLVFAGGLGAAGLALTARRSGLTVADRRALWLVGTGILSNAAICGVLSVPVERYQSRVAWVLPLVALAVLLPALRRDRPPLSAATPSSAW